MQLLSQSPEAANPELSSVQPARVAIAFNRESEKAFRSHFDPDRLPAAVYEWVDVATLRGAAWEEFLCAWKPTVLMTGWGTPPIPEHYSQTADLSLRYICHLTGSVKQLVPRHLIKRGVLVSNWGGTISFCVAEHALLMVLATLRNLPAWRNALDGWNQRTGVSPFQTLETRTLRGKRVGLHGFGSIAIELVRMLQPFNVQLSAYSQGVPASLFERQGVRQCASLEELFSGSDVLIECEALTLSNRGSVNRRVLACLPPGAVFVNVGRGSVVDEDALMAAAHEKKLRLGIDVFQHEPLPATSPWHGLPRTLLSPHVAGPTVDAFGGLCEFALANLNRHLLGEPVEAEVSLEIYDRST